MIRTDTATARSWSTKRPALDPRPESGHSLEMSAGLSESDPPDGRTRAAGDYPVPRSITRTRTFDWNDECPEVENLVALGRRLAEAGDLFRNTGYGDGLLLVPLDARVPPMRIDHARDLWPVIVDRVRVRVLRGGECRGHSLPTRVLSMALRSEAFLRQFRPVDRVDEAARYLPDFTPTVPGYNDGGYGRRVLLRGPEARVETEPAAIRSFLGVMDFAGQADRTGAVTAALTVLLRDHWPGGKPIIAVTADKSHAGKDTVICFASGNARPASISYESADWALEDAFVAALGSRPEPGVIVLENARLDRGRREIASAFVERIVTDPSPLLSYPGPGGASRRRSDFVVAVSTNEGRLSEDLMNRALPIHLSTRGDVAARVSPIGNPKAEFLPANRDRIEAELRGMVGRRVQAGRPTDDSARHPFSAWAGTIGGILKVNGFGGFLANYGRRRTALDPVKQALGLLGAARPGEWLRSAEWVAVAEAEGLVRCLIPANDRDTGRGRERGIGVVLSAHEEETFQVSTEDEELVLRLGKARRRSGTGGEAKVRYRFEVLGRTPVPADPASFEDPPAGEALLEPGA